MTKNHLSMTPLILPADKPVVKKTSKYEVNDIVIFNKENRLIAHRVIYESPNNDYFIIKGDNNLRSDGKVSKKEILGVVKKIKRSGESVTLSHVYLSQSSTYLKELRKINKVFIKQKIQYVLLKGLPLHLYFDKTPPKRLYLDADLLIKKKDFQKTARILKSLSFKPEGAALFGEKIKNPSQICFIKKTKPFPTVIDLHLEPAVGFTKIKSPNKLLPSKKKFEKYLFENIKSVKVNENKFPILTTETLLIYLLLHLYHHNFQGAHRMGFINNLVRNQKIDWNKATNIVQKFKLKSFVFPGTLVLEHYYQTLFPKNFIEAISPPVTQKFISRTVARFVSPFNSGGRTQEGVKRFILILLLSPSSASQKIKVLLEKETRNYFLSTIKSFFLRSSKK